MPFCVPEPEPNKSEAEQDASPYIHQVIVPSSDEDNEEENQPHLNGYEPLPLADNDESSDEDDAEYAVDNNIPQKTFEIDQDLVRNMMKNVKLDLSSIPPWAKEISESAWNEVVQQTVGKGTSAVNSDDSSPGCSQTEHHLSMPS